MKCKKHRAKDAETVLNSWSCVQCLFLAAVAKVQFVFRRMDTEICTRSPPHVCRVNGPCNGYPKCEPITKV
jgi:hypothetical protein